MPAFGQDERVEANEMEADAGLGEILLMKDPLQGKPLQGFERFQWSAEKEPHAARKEAMLKAHPEVRSRQNGHLPMHGWREQPAHPEPESRERR